ncbi:MAG: hypothetical protein HZA08_01460 [Nitrospirae bacterium]|nr:hypothetical protein [Nitrospirota bacterium]
MNQDNEKPHPHLNPLPEGEEIPLPFKGRVSKNQRDKNVPPILNLCVDRRGFLTPPERIFG